MLYAWMHSERVVETVKADMAAYCGRRDSKAAGEMQSGSKSKLLKVSKRWCITLVYWKCFSYLFTDMLAILEICTWILRFNDAVSNSGYIAPNGRNIREKWIGKDVEGSGGGFISALCRHFDQNYFLSCTSMLLMNLETALFLKLVFT
jgi:hypothetical protein